MAVAAARYGRRSAVITRTGQDPFGEYLHDALRGFGVDDRYVTAVPGLPTLGWKTPRQALARSLRLPLEGTAVHLGGVSSHLRAARVAPINGPHRVVPG